MAHGGVLETAEVRSHDDASKMGDDTHAATMIVETSQFRSLRIFDDRYGISWNKRGAPDTRTISAVLIAPRRVIAAHSSRLPLSRALHCYTGYRLIPRLIFGLSPSRYQRTNCGRRRFSRYHWWSHVKRRSRRSRQSARKRRIRRCPTTIYRDNYAVGFVR